MKTRIWLAILLMITAWQLTAKHAYAQEDKSGVKPQVISLPTGPGSLESLGESFTPDLNSGTASYSVPLAVPPGVADLTPSVTLLYNGGNGNGVCGMGWKINTPYIQRQTDEGVPSYDDNTDRFIYSDNAEKLVVLENDDYRFEIENSFMRFRRLADGGWEAHSPDGNRYRFGVDEESRETNDLGVFRWRLEEISDSNGNRIEYRYMLDGGHRYVQEIRYNFSSDGRYNTVSFKYEGRDDVTTSRVSRRPMTLAKRCHQIEMWALGKFVGRYELAYRAASHTAISQLISVTQVGSDGISTLPATQFGYTQYESSTAETHSVQNPPPLALGHPDVDLVDKNGDSLPDIVHTRSQDYRYYINRGNGVFQESAEIATRSPRIQLSQSNVNVADVTGDGFADLLIKTQSGFYYYDGRGAEEWSVDHLFAFPVNPNFSLSDPSVRWLDVNNDKRIDIIRITPDLTYIYLAQEEDGWSETPDFIRPTASIGEPLTFDNPYVHCADMSGDRMQDLVYVRNGLVLYFPALGNGELDTPVTFTNPPAGIAHQETQMRVADINNDGLADLILPSNRQVRYWLNRGDGSLSDAIVLSDTPAYSANNTTLRIADIDGDGANELLFSRYPAAESEVLQYVDFHTETQPNLLSTIDNGLGRTYEIAYQSSVDFYISDWNSDNVWETKLPFPVQVVSRMTIHDAASGDAYITDYRYRDGFYEGDQKEFRGFARVEMVEVGDETADTTRTTHIFDTGENVESRKGMLLEKMVTDADGDCQSADNCYWHDVNQIETRTLETHNENSVTYSFVSQTDNFIYETLEDPIQLQQQFDRDEFGNVVEQLNYGQVCDGDVTCGADEQLQYTTYALNEEAWLLNYPARTWQTDAAGNWVSETRYYYDGGAFAGLSLGAIERGNLSRQTAGVTQTEFITPVRQRFDAYGNIVEMQDANGNRTTVEYDALVHTFPVVEQLHFEDGHKLTMVAAYDEAHGNITGATNFEGQAFLYEYDIFGRITAIIQPGDSHTHPTQQFTYTLGTPVNAITTVERVESNTDNVRLSIAYFDGLGRPLQKRQQADDGQVVVSDAKTFNQRQSVMRSYLPYFDNSMSFAMPAPTSAHTKSYYDPFGRVTRIINPDDSWILTVYQPLAEIQYDEEDNRPISPHFDTPKRLFYDGIGRIVGVEEINTVDGQQETYRTTYEYDTVGNLTQIADAQNNLTTMQYDGISRRSYMNNPDRGETFYTYDDVGNLIETQDAKGQIIRYEYDAGQRPLTERWLVDGVETVAHRYHYDTDLAPDYLDAQNTLGQLTYIEDVEGAVYFSYDQRGSLSQRARYFSAEDRTFVTQMQHNANNQLVQLTYPDGMTVTYEYNARGLVSAVPNYVTNVAYAASGQRASITYANGVTTDYSYDERLRMTHLYSASPAEVFQDLSYLFDANSNILEITDGRTNLTNENDQTQQFVYDNLYRLTQATGSYGDINYSYNSIGNIVYKDSTADDPRLQLGTMHYGENGTGPHALTTTSQDTYTYDANGNRTTQTNTTYNWDARNQLTRVVQPNQTSTYTYDASGQRLRQSVNDGISITSTLYIDQYSEQRDGEYITYVHLNGKRTAQISNEITTYHLVDHLDSINIVLNDVGESLSKYDYYPYGLVHYETTDTATLYKFAGKELDTSENYYFASRYYDPLTANFLSVDPFYLEPEKVLKNPIAANLYLYTFGNPQRYTDPTGMVPKSNVPILKGRIEHTVTREESVSNHPQLTKTNQTPKTESVLNITLIGSEVRDIFGVRLPSIKWMIGERHMGFAIFGDVSVGIGKFVGNPFLGEIYHSKEELHPGHILNLDGVFAAKGAMGLGVGGENGLGISFRAHKKGVEVGKHNPTSVGVTTGIGASAHAAVRSEYQYVWKLHTK